jgi:hypothetical protein
VIPAQSRGRYPRRAEWIEPIGSLHEDRKHLPASRAGGGTVGSQQALAAPSAGKPLVTVFAQRHPAGQPYQIVKQYDARPSPERVRVSGG